MEKPTPSIKFYGADTDKWIGRILSNDAQKTQIEGGGFGLRYKVAIMGYHTSDEGELKNEDITYALVRLGVTDGTGAGGRMRSPRLTQGDVVTGEFLDGAARQQPIITGALGRVGGERKGKGRFESKTGFWGGLKPGNLLERDEANETSSPPCVPKAIPKGSGSDKTDKRETDKESLKAAGIDPDGEPKVGEVKKPEGNDLSPQERQDALNSDLTTADKLGPESDVLVYGKDGKTKYQRGLERLGASPEEAAQQAARARASILEDRKEFEEAAAFEAALNAPVTDEERANVDANLNQ